MEKVASQLINGTLIPKFRQALARRCACQLLTQLNTAKIKVNVPKTYAFIKEHYHPKALTYIEKFSL